MQKVIAAYTASADPRISNYIEFVRNNPHTKETLPLGTVADRVAQEIYELVDFDPSGYTEQLNSAALTHIDIRHGKEGKADHSMSDINDISRMKYVMDNYDDIRLEVSCSKAFSDKNGKAARKVVFSKRIDGTYYVVEAVPESAAKKLHVVSAYIEKAAQQAPLDSSVGSTSDNAPVETAFIDTNIAQNAHGVKNIIRPSSAVDAIEKIYYPDSEPVITKSNRATVESGKANGVSNAQIKRVGSIASAIKVDVVFDAEAGINGKYENGVIHINPNSRTPVLDTFFHELTHHIESAEGYRCLQDRILESGVFLSSIAGSGMSLAQYRQSIIDNYARQGVTLDEAGANAEMTAEFVKEHLFKDQKAIDRLCETDVSLGRRILSWIEELVVKLKGKPEQKALLEMEKMYKEALAGAKVVNNGKTQYSYDDSLLMQFKDWLNGKMPAKGYFEICDTEPFPAKQTQKSYQKQNES